MKDPHWKRDRGPSSWEQAITLNTVTSSFQTASQSLLFAAPEQHHSAFLHSLSHTMTGGAICHFSSCFLCTSPVRLKRAWRVTEASFWALGGPHQDKEAGLNLLYYFFLPCPSFQGCGLHWALCPKTLFLRKVQTAMPGFSLFMSEQLRAWND